MTPLFHISRRVWSFAGALVAAAIVAALLLVCFSATPRPFSAKLLRPPVAPIGPDFPMLSVDVPAQSNPLLHSADEANVHEDDMVIGIVVNGVPRAYLRDAFNGGPHRHAVQDAIESTTVAITHCDRLHCTRVLSSAGGEQPLELRIGGWRTDQTMELIVNDRGYSQKSTNIPLADVPFVELPWGQWRELFPDTLIYLGESAGIGRDLSGPSAATSAAVSG